MEYCTLETCVSLSLTTRVCKEAFKSLEDTAIRDKLSLRVPWMYPGEDNSGMRTWGDCARVFCARKRNLGRGKWIQINNINEVVDPETTDPSRWTSPKCRLKPTQVTRLPADFECLFDCSLGDPEDMHYVSYTKHNHLLAIDVDATINLKTLLVENYPDPRDDNSDMDTSTTEKEFFEQSNKCYSRYRDADLDFPFPNVETSSATKDIWRFGNFTLIVPKEVTVLWMDENEVEHIVFCQSFLVGILGTYQTLNEYVFFPKQYSQSGQSGQGSSKYILDYAKGGFHLFSPVNIQVTPRACFIEERKEGQYVYDGTYLDLPWLRSPFPAPDGHIVINYVDSARCRLVPIAKETSDWEFPEIYLAFPPNDSTLAVYGGLVWQSVGDCIENEGFVPFFVDLGDDSKPTTLAYRKGCYFKFIPRSYGVFFFKQSGFQSFLASETSFRSVTDLATYTQYCADVRDGRRVGDDDLDCEYELDCYMDHNLVFAGFSGGKFGFWSISKKLILDWKEQIYLQRWISGTVFTPVDLEKRIDAKRYIFDYVPREILLEHDCFRGELYPWLREGYDVSQHVTPNGEEELW